MANNEKTKEEIAADKEAEKQAKAEQRAKEREEKRLAKEAEKEAKKKEREEARVAKAKAKEEEKARKAAEREANRMPEQNGIRRPKPNTLCGRVWSLADEKSAELKQPVPIAVLLEEAAKYDLNVGNVKAEYARWRKFNGVTGRVSLPKPEKEEKAKK